MINKNNGIMDPVLVSFEKIKLSHPFDNNVNPTLQHVYIYIWKRIR